MLECPECKAVIESGEAHCPECGSPVDSISMKPRYDTNQDNINGSKAFFARQSRWSKFILAFPILYLGAGLLLLPFSNSIIGAVISTIILLAGLPLCYALHHDGKAMRADYNWPRLRGFHYSLIALFPLANFFIAITYILGRSEVVHRGTPLFSLQRLRTIRRQPSGLVRSMYAGLGVFFTTFFLSFVLLGYPAQALPQRLELIKDALSFIGIIIPFFALGIYRYGSTGTTKILENSLRDISIRLVAVIGITLLATLLLFALAIPGGIVVAITENIFGDRFGEALSEAISFPMLVLPLAVIFVLILRTLPWIRSAGYAIRTAGSWIVQQAKNATPTSTTDPDSKSNVAIIPIRGHDHTDLHLQSATDIEMSGIYGYTSKPVDEIDTTTLRSSWRRGLAFLIPGYVVAVAMYTYFQLYPERAAEYASIFPAEDILVASLSLAGVPRTAIVQAIQFMQVPPEALSMGFLGMAIPALLMIPGAWHLALEYEGYLYRFHQRLGDGNHLLLLWGMHVFLIAPIVIAYRWVNKRNWNFRLPTLGS